MTTEEILEKMRAWVLAEIEKAKRPGMDPFTLTSLTFCAIKAAGDDAYDLVREKFWAAARDEGLGRYDVVTPDEALRLIEIVRAA